MENSIFDLARLRELEAFVPKEQLNEVLKLFKRDYDLPRNFSIREIEDVFGAEDFYSLLRGYLPSKLLDEFETFYSNLTSSVNNSYHIYNLSKDEVLFTDPDYTKCVFEYGKLNRGNRFGSLEIVDDSRLKQLRSKKEIASALGTFGAPVKTPTVYEGVAYISGYSGEKYAILTNCCKYGSYSHPLSWSEVIKIYNRNLGVPNSFEPGWEDRLKAYVDELSTQKETLFNG